LGWARSKQRKYNEDSYVSRDRTEPSGHNRNPVCAAPEQSACGCDSCNYNLIHIPFVSVRDNLPGDLLKEPKDPGTLALSLIKEETSRLTVNLISGKIIYKKIEVDMMPAHLALYAFFAMQKKNCLNTDFHRWLNRHNLPPISA